MMDGMAGTAPRISRFMKMAPANQQKYNNNHAGLVNIHPYTVSQPAELAMTKIQQRKKPIPRITRGSLDLFLDKNKRWLCLFFFHTHTVYNCIIAYLNN